MYKKLIGVALFALAGVTFLFAQDAVSPPHHGAMEILGVGPEMFADRGKAWVEAFAVVLDTLVAKVGILIIAIIAMRRNITSTELQARVDRVDARVANNTQEITKVALSVPVVTNEPTPVTVVNPLESPAEVHSNP